MRGSDSSSASEWLAGALEGVSHQRWGSGNLPHGTLALPKRTLIADDTLEIPFRHCLQGADLHALKLWGIVAGEGMPLGAPILRSGLDWSAARDARVGRPVDYNGNFGTHWRDFYLDCADRAGGIWFGGAQCSSVQNVVIRHARGDALRVMNGSTRVRITDVDIENGDPNGDRTGAGIVIDRCRGVLVENVNLHACWFGFSVFDSASVTVVNPVLEKVDRVALSGLGNTVTGMNWQWPGDTPFDLEGDQGGTRIDGCLSKLPGPELFYLDNRGQRKSLMRVSSVFEGSRQLHFELRTRWVKWLKRTEVKVDLTTWNS